MKHAAKDSPSPSMFFASSPLVVSLACTAYAPRRSTAGDQEAYIGCGKLNRKRNADRCDQHQQAASSPPASAATNTYWAWSTTRRAPPTRPSPRHDACIAATECGGGLAGDPPRLNVTGFV